MTRKLPIANGIKMNMNSQSRSELILKSLYNPKIRGAIPHNPKITIVDHALNLSPPISPKQIKELTYIPRPKNPIAQSPKSNMKSGIKKQIRVKPVDPSRHMLMVRMLMQTGQKNWPSPEKNRKQTDNEPPMMGTRQVSVANARIIKPRQQSCRFWQLLLSPTNSSAFTMLNSGVFIIGKPDYNLQYYNHTTLQAQGYFKLQQPMNKPTTSPEPKSKEKTTTTSPIRVKDYFTNPLHKIKQPAFTEVGFTVSALNTFVKNFTNRTNSKYINFQEIKSYIKKFTNNNGKLMQMYEDFFIKNFKIKDGLIEGEHFVEFFVRENKQGDLSSQNIKKIYQDMTPLNAENLLKKSEYLQVPLSREESQKIIKMVNYTYQASGNEISYENFSLAVSNIE